jgi:hypothetical protein
MLRFVMGCVAAVLLVGGVLCMFGPALWLGVLLFIVGITLAEQVARP